jgi:hypothetical protein
MTMLNQPDFQEENYKINLALLAKRDALTASKLELLQLSNKISVCETSQGEPNLCQNKYGIQAYYHSQKGALEESKKLITKDIEEGESLFVYGLGLGYIYDSLENWLNEKSNHSLIFLEDDLEVIYYFLHTSRATRLLQNPKVALFVFNEYQANYENFQSLLTAYFNTKLNFIALPFYAIKKTERAYALCYSILYDFSQMNMLLMEYLTGQNGFINNYYRNLFLLPSSYLASGMFQQFKNIPAIICGAGPSLQKNVHLLQNVKDKAVIFAGGSSLNVLNSFGINPHFGVGVDPNKEQKHRLMTNNTFHIPFLYRPRVSHEIFKVLQGPKIYISGSDNLTAKWFEQELDISIPLLDEGHNVVNLATEVAYRMGFNPIIYVGMDLAFTEVQTYAQGVHTHPLALEVSQPYALKKEAYVHRQDIFGRPIKSKWDWIGEANWLSHFATTHPDVKIINATEGGLGFKPVPNIDLQKVIDQHLNETYDLAGCIHTEVQNNPVKFKQAQLIQLIIQFKNSLDRCQDHYKKIIEEKMDQLKNPSDSSPEFYTTTTIVEESKIIGEIAYQNYLSMIDSVYSYIQRSQCHYKNNVASAFEQNLSKMQFIQSAIENHVNHMTDAFKLFLFNKNSLSQSQESLKPLESENAIYQFKQGHLQIRDPRLDIAIDDLIFPEDAIERKAVYYANGENSVAPSLKQESYYYENELYGPSRFYSPSGQLLSESWFFKNQQQGKSIQYYPSGKLYSIRGFKNNILHGPQQYFHENGHTCVYLNYKEGLLDGTVETYTEEGSILRKINYSNGKRHGEEKMWHPNGQLVIECSYYEGQPIGEAKEWTPTGWLFKDVKIIRYPDKYDVTIYNKEGEKIQIFESGLEDHSILYQKAQQKLDAMNASLDQLFAKMEPFIQDHIEEMALKNPAILQELAAIQKTKEEMDNLQALLQQTMKDNIQRNEEAKQRMKDS